MDFNSLVNGSPFYVLRKSGTPALQIGTVKSKTQPQPKYQAQSVPTAFNGTNIQQVINVTATIDGRDETFTDIPFNVEVAQSGDKVFSGSRDAMISVIDSLISQSKKALGDVEYHKTMIAEGDKMLEVLNPKYAEEKKQAQTISDLEKGYSDMSKRFAKLETDNAQMLAMLKKLTGENPKKP
jgi:hypothetical protein